MFVGVHDRLLDDKGRLALPATFRGDLGDRCYLSLGDEGCVVVRTIDDFEQHARELIEQHKRGELSAAQLRVSAADSTQVAIDKQGRITLEAKFREHGRLQLGGAVKVNGRFDAIEIWRPERFERVEVEGHDERNLRHWEDGE